jgi:hypothetical protein
LTAVQELLDTLARGDDAAIAARIYGAESLPDSARQIPLGLLRRLRAPRPGLHLQVVERHRSGRFELLILRVPWLAGPGDPAGGHHPLLVAEQGGSPRAVGFVLPWNEVLPQLEAEMPAIMPLSLLWISRPRGAPPGA